MKQSIDKIDLIVNHCADTPPSLDGGLAEIDRWHKEKGWSGCGYHFIVRKDGTIENGRPLTEVGAHTYGQNKNSIGICWFGGSKGLDDRTEAQKEALIQLHSDLREKLPNPNIRIASHSEFSDKRCPNFNAFKEYQYLMLKLS